MSFFNLNYPNSINVQTVPKLVCLINMLSILLSWFLIVWLVDPWLAGPEWFGFGRLLFSLWSPAMPVTPLSSQWPFSFFFLDHSGTLDRHGSSNPSFVKQKQHKHVVCLYTIKNIYKYSIPQQNSVQNSQRKKNKK